MQRGTGKRRVSLTAAAKSVKRKTMLCTDESTCRDGLLEGPSTSRSGAVVDRLETDPVSGHSTYQQGASFSCAQCPQETQHHHAMGSNAPDNPCRHGSEHSS